MLWVIIGVVLIAGLVVARNHKSTTTPSDSGSTPAASASQSPSAMTSSDTSNASPASSAAATPADTSSAATSQSSTTSTSSAATDLAPVGIVAHYTKTGAAIFWYPATGATGIATYNIEVAKNGGEFKILATVPASQVTLNVTKTDGTGWTSFKISAVYQDGTTVAGKVFGLPGQYN